MVESANVRPARSAARTAAFSPSWCISRVNPVGASANGSGHRLPSTVTPVSAVLTSRSAIGWNSARAKLARARRRLASWSAAPSA